MFGGDYFLVNRRKFIREIIKTLVCVVAYSCAKK